jgi:NitT/TauT family transport system substrate-binding protein
VAVTDLSVFVPIVSQGAKLKTVAVFAQSNLGCLVYRTDRGIKTPKDLEGKTIGIDSGGTDQTLVPVALTLAGVDPKKVTLVTSTAQGKQAALLAGRVDAITGFVNTIPAMIRAAGTPAEVFTYRDMGVPLMGTGLIVTQGMIDTAPNAVRGLVKGILKAWKDAQADPSAAITAQEQGLPNVAIDHNLNVQSLKDFFPLLTTPQTASHGIGYSDSAAWQAMLDFIKSTPSYNVPTVLPVDNYFTNSFLPTQ